MKSLKELLEEIKSAEKKAQRLAGAMDADTKRLKKEFGLSPKKVEQFLGEKAKQISAKKKQLKKGKRSLEKKYGIN